ncbi:phage tail protein [Flavobacterium cerinum]|uniref:Phage tail protein n=1 Tax=Flavobacterium cerinum TaxID=2502784 RepID=A0A3S3QZA1_9FLAO|nr:tail fiber protein [Flavobacterium cerinum]RWW98751.1 phage tail protein [Flavobacterium cerinum]
MEEFIGVIKLFAGNFAPRGWAMCNGQLLPINQYNAVFAILGTTYGGDGQTTFGLPNLQSRVPIGMGQGPGLSNYVQGQISGAEQIVLTVNQMPAHNHTASVKVSSANATLDTATPGASIATPGSIVSRAFVPTLGFNSATPDVQLVGTTVTNSIAGANSAVPLMQPYMAMNYIICLEGIFPTRD